MLFFFFSFGVDEDFFVPELLEVSYISWRWEEWSPNFYYLASQAEKVLNMYTWTLVSVSVHVGIWSEEPFCVSGPIEERFFEVSHLFMVEPMLVS